METLYWNGSLDETKRLARTIAVERGAEMFLVIECDGSGAVVYSEQHPFAETTSLHGPAPN